MTRLERVLRIGQGASDAKRPAGLVERQTERGPDERFPRPVVSLHVRVEQQSERLRVRQGQGDDHHVPIDLGGQVRGGHDQDERDVALARREVAQGAHDAGIGEPRMEIEHDARDACFACFAGARRAFEGKEGLARGRVIRPTARRRPLEHANAAVGVADERAGAALLVRHDAHDRHARRGGGS